MQVKVYLANLKLNRIYHFEKQKIIANDYLTQTLQIHSFISSPFGVKIDPSQETGTHERGGTSS